MTHYESIILNKSIYEILEHTGTPNHISCLKLFFRKQFEVNKDKYIYDESIYENFGQKYLYIKGALRDRVIFFLKILHNILSREK